MKLTPRKTPVRKSPRKRHTRTNWKGPSCAARVHVEPRDTYQILKLVAPTVGSKFLKDWWLGDVTKIWAHHFIEVNSGGCQFTFGLKQDKQSKKSTEVTSPDFAQSMGASAYFKCTRAKKKDCKNTCVYGRKRGRQYTGTHVTASKEMNQAQADVINWLLDNARPKRIKNKYTMVTKLPFHFTWTAHSELCSLIWDPSNNYNCIRFADVFDKQAEKLKKALHA